MKKSKIIYKRINQYVTLYNDINDELPQLKYLDYCIDGEGVHTSDVNCLSGCACTDCFTTQSECSCFNENCDIVNAIIAPYDKNGKIMYASSRAIYECNKLCKCSSNCYNRVVQRGMKFLLEIYKTHSKGWAVRAGEDIPKGHFVSEYVGEIITEKEANKRTYSLSYHYMLDTIEQNSAPYCIDAMVCGNVSRFINHSCNPNLENYQIFIDDLNPHKPRIAFFARRDIKKEKKFLSIIDIL